MGEHAAVYGRPALVAAVDRRSTATITDTDGTPGEVHLDLPGLGVRRTTTWRDAVARAEEARRAWERFDATDGATFDDLRPVDRSTFVDVAVGEALRGRLPAGGTADRPAVRLRVTSELPIGSGFGSSASVAVAVVRAVHGHFGFEADADELHAVSLEVERRQHGRPSGVDNATVIHGGVVWVERRVDRGEGGRLRIDPLEVAADGSPILRRLRVFHTGEPAEPTGEVVAAVRRLRARDPEAFDVRLDAMEDATAEVRALLAGGDPAAVVGPVRRFQAALEALGVVPTGVRHAVRAVETAGGAAKISGAGSLAGPGAGSLLVYHPEREVIERIADAVPALASWERLDLRLGAAGARIENEVTDPRV